VTAQLRKHAGSFGAALQLVSILTDIAHGGRGRHAYVPHSTVLGLERLDPREPIFRARAHLAVPPLIERAHELLESGFSYCLAIPRQRRDLRMLCLPPLLMAAQALAETVGAAGPLVPAHTLRNGRQGARAIVERCARIAASDADLQRAFHEILYRDTPEYAVGTGTG
jgi:phytoene/squalene synthetase